MNSYEKYRQLWVNTANTLIAPPAPINIDIELNKTCNLKCAMCPSSIQRSRGIMDFDLAKRILNEAKGIGVRSVKMNWRGEPTLYPYFYEISRYAHSLDFDDLMLNTNGMYANRKIKTALFNYYTTVVFSIDAYDPDIFKSCRSGSIPDLIFYNLVTTAAYRDKHGKPEFLVVNHVRQKKNWPEYNIIKMLCERKRVKFRAMLAFNRTDDDHLHYIDHRPTILGRKACSFPFQRLTIGYNGNVYPCCCIWDDDDRLLLDNVNYTSLQEIWDGKMLREIRENEKQNPIIKKNPVCDKKCISWLTYKTDKPTLFDRYEK